MKYWILNILLILLPIIWFAIVIYSLIGANTLTYLYRDQKNRAGFELKWRRFGPSNKEIEKIIQTSKDNYTVQKAKDAIQAKRKSIIFLYLFIALYLVTICLNRYFI